MSSFALTRDAALTDTLARLVAAIPDPLERRVLAPLALDELLFRLLRSEAAAAVRRGVGHAADAPRILSTMQHIRKRYADKLTVSGLAKLAAMSPSHFAHRFSAVARLSPMRFLREVRLERARVLLATPGARVSEVAMEVGFESPAHFAREFKRRYGSPPSRSSDQT
jgi:AraC-like DNA-binding protein